ncbi:MAG: Holliday junction resolvase RuvX [Oscillospiraceae bacterium]|jgi:putative Holliday junction resolvase|nr:Holliday junction resolvase RuvX [Oscillospiraceae bacterium]
MIIVSIDYGDVRTGLASCDDSEFLVTPRSVIKERDKHLLAEKIARVSAEYGAEKLVVGYPLNMDGTAGIRADKCAAFAELLKAHVTIPIELFDERCSTAEAHEILGANGVKNKNRKNKIDAVAAAVILESYLQQR